MPELRTSDRSSDDGDLSFGGIVLIFIASAACTFGFYAWDKSRRPPPPPPLRLTVVTPEGCRVYARPSGREFVVCPDGWRQSR